MVYNLIFYGIINKYKDKFEEIDMKDKRSIIIKTVTIICLLTFLAGVLIPPCLHIFGEFFQ